MTCIRYAALAMGCLLLVGQARASGDYGCEPRFRPGTNAYSACDNTPLLSPGNDTRLNLALLIADRHRMTIGRYLPETSPSNSPPLVVPFSWDDLLSRQSPPGREGDDSDSLSAFAMGEGTTCVSDTSGRNDFLKALSEESGLSADERRQLGEARAALACQGDGAGSGGDTTTGEMGSVAAQEFRRYLDAISVFYAGTYDPNAFTALARSKQSWIREASLYMVGRAWALHGQQDGYGVYGDIDRSKMDRASLGKAVDGLGAYLKAYPNGRYAASARGLLRRVHWLAGDFDALAAGYRWQIEQADASKRNLSDIDLAMEIDAKLPFEAYASDSMPPLLLAVDDLRRMRLDLVAPDGSPVPRIARKELEAQKKRFSREPALYQYLLAAYAWFVENKPDAVLSTLRADDREPLDTLGFSRQLLRALALDATNDNQARPALLALVPRVTQPHQRQTVELALAMHYERVGALPAVFADDSPIRDGRFRERLLIHIADSDLLRARFRAAGVSTHEGALALYILLYKELTRGRYAVFLADIKLIPAGKLGTGGQWSKIENDVALADFRWEGTRDGYRCPPLAQVAIVLAKTPQDHGARLCLGEFLRLNSYDHTSLDQPPPSDELGGSPGLFTGRALVRMDIYKATIADAAASDNDRAYALYRAVQCFAPSGYNECSDEEVPVEERKAWFKRLKSQYPNSSWAKSLKYYW